MPPVFSTKSIAPSLTASTALSIVREKESGTMEQVRMAPIDTFSFVIGKTIPYFMISLASAALIVVAVVPARWANPARKCCCDFSAMSMPILERAGSRDW